MKHVVYLNNYIGQEVKEKRENNTVCSQAANNKISGVVTALTSNSCKVEVISSGLVNSRCLKKYKRMVCELDGNKIVYGSVIGIPFISSIWSFFSIYHEIKRINRKEKIDNIIFYNFKPEVAFAAYFAKKNLNIPITVEYEDGISNIESKIKSFIFRKTEKIVKTQIDSAIVVNSLSKKNFKVPSVTIRGIINPVYYEECQNKQKIENEIFTVLYSGGLEPVRGIDVLMEAIKYIDFPLKVQITGGKKLQTEDKRIEFLGYLEYGEVQNLMMKADVLVQAQLVNSSFASKSFPSKIFEYLPTENIIVSSALPDVVNFAKDAFFYYENDSAKDLANVITEIYLKFDKIKNKEKLKKLCLDNMPLEVGKKIINIL